ncbi:MAG: phosphate signaling complex PhoU family protein [Acidimicrobiales bacterium]
MPEYVDTGVAQLFALVSEALAGATYALLEADTTTARLIVDRDRYIDKLAAEVEAGVWAEVDKAPRTEVRRLFTVLMILPELERSADLAEHIARRAVDGIGQEMSPLSRGLMQRMTEVALEMWAAVAEAYEQSASVEANLAEADEELDILRDRLTAEVATGKMESGVAAQVTLLGRFYERLGDHAVNLSRRIGTSAR